MCSLPILKLLSTDFLGRFWKIIIFVYFGLIFNITSMFCKMNEVCFLKQFCNPILDLDKIIQSSAYNSEFIFVPFGKQMDQIVCFRINTGQIV